MMGFGRTKSVCPVCLRVLEAQKTVGEHGIYLNKTCPEHGAFSALIWEGSIKEYFMWNGESSAIDPPVNGKEPQRGCPNDCGLCSAHLRKGCCMLLELTRRCNLECPVCYASAGKCGDDPNIEDIERQYDFLMAHGGPFNIQLSGGEPTLREDLPEIIWLGRQKGFTFFQLNTNGIRLAAEPDYAKSLKAAGLNTVFLQFDGMSDAVYEALRGRPLLREKLAAIESCAAAGLGIVLVPVIAPGVNEEEAGGILRLAMTRMPYVRGVHFQPLSYFGRYALKRAERPVTIPRMLRLIEKQTEGMMKYADFCGGGAESPYCSFHASYMRRGDGSLRLLGRRGGSCCATSDDSRSSVAGQWSWAEWDTEAAQKKSGAETASLDEFLEYARRNTFAVSGMVFQDAYDLDLERLMRCHICEVDPRHGMVPFCAYNLTDPEGLALYREP
jgi:uncharacterized radical SAM superfamily Fe-S cluster-containing enzyme